MRIGFPMDNVVPGRAGGTETYARNLIAALQRIDDVNEYMLFCSNFNAEAFPVTGSNFRKVVIKRSMLLDRAICLTAGVFAFMEDTPGFREFKKAVKRFLMAVYRKIFPPAETKREPAYDILHYMFTTFPYCEDLGAPVVLTMHDIQQEYFPEFFNRGELKNRRRFYRPSAEKADHIITISEFSKKTIVEKYGIPAGKITVVYNGCDKEAFKRLDGETVEGFRKRHDLPRSFLVYPAATWPHKNHLNFIRAFKILKEKHRLQDKLVLTGIKKENHRTVEGEIKKLGLGADVRHLGYLPYEELPLLYNAARLMVFPSLFEGFGMPVVEAMAAGLPVACSNTTSLPEVAGDAALFFDPERPDDIAEKVSTICNDTALRESLIKKGFERAGLFTWERTSEKTLKVYEKVYGDFCEWHLERIHDSLINPPAE